MKLIILSSIAVLLSIVSAQPMVKKGPCDDTRECIRYDFENSDRILCFGYYACKGAEMASDQKAVCSGANACTRARFTTSVDSILCNGFKSCQRSRQMTNNNKIACNGLKSCTDIVGGLNAPDIRCDGDIACTNFKSKKNSDLSLNLNAVGAGDASLLYCNGNQVCRDTQQRSDGLIYCDGDGACKESRMQADKIECQGKRSCKDTIMQPNSGAGSELESIKCHGWFGCAGANVIMATNVDAYGFNALTKAVIETRGISQFNLKAYGFRALAGASIDCKGSVCNIDCKGNACKGVPISVAKSSTLNLTPQECDPNNDACEPSKNDPAVCKKIAGINCPAVIYARNDQTDEELAALRQSYVDAFEASEEYQEYLEIQDIADQESELYIDERLRDYEMENEYDEEEGDDEFFAQQNNEYLFGENVSLQTQIASSLITSNLLTAVAVFLLTGGLIYFIFNKYRNGYKSLQ